MARRSGSGPPKRERPALAGTGALENNNSSTAGNRARRGGAQAAQLISDVRFRRRVQHLERLGGRVTGELLAQLAVEFGCLPQIEAFVDRCIEREDVIRKLGFDRWPDLPLRQVPR